MTTALSIASAPRPGARLTRAEMWAAFAGSDRRYDGRFVTAVRTTGIFCRPSCTCRKPRPDRVAFFPTPEAAAGAGFRPCKRCRPELAGGAAEAERRMAERALEFMRAHCGERLALADLARAVAMSPSHFARRFRAATGDSPMRTLAAVRAERAGRLLARAGTGVLEVALAVGFGSAAALVRAFRRRTGTTPSRWRARRPVGPRHARRITGGA
ncbi:MAG TPA: Ada metal-binding domain-containing protein [Candidatus Eisenbacteria bacterium]|jgi:methylphosphotriester-DNA--protein-cysteine methyltransferase